MMIKSQWGMPKNNTMLFFWQRVIRLQGSIKPKSADVQTQAVIFTSNGKAIELLWNDKESGFMKNEEF